MWINGRFSVSDDAEGVLFAKKEIDRIILENSNYEEFPNMKAENNFRFLTDTVFGSEEEASAYMDKNREAWVRNYNPICRYREGMGTRLLIGYEEYCM